MKTTMILMVAGVAFLLSGVIMLLWAIQQPSAFLTADAVFLSKIRFDSPGKVKLQVRFEVDGQTVEKYTQPIRESQLRGEVGSHVPVVYRRGRMLVLETWQIYAYEDAESASQRVRRMNELAAAAAILSGICLLAVSVVLSRMSA